MKEFFGVASLVVACTGYIPYIRDILKHKTKPHALSWLVWAVLSAIAFAVQLTNNGGPGAWLMGLTTIITFSIFLLSIKNDEKNVLLVDWLSFIFAGIALLLWFVTDRPLLSVVLISLIDGVGGFLPTFRKSITNPQQETITLYLLYAVSLAFSLIALNSFTLVNALYPASFVLINLSMTVFLIVRRAIVARSTTAL